MPYFEDAGEVVSDPSQWQPSKTKRPNGKAIEFTQQAERLAQFTPSQENSETGNTQAVSAHYVTAHDAVIETANGGRLPAVPLDEAVKLNQLRDELEGREPQSPPEPPTIREALDGSLHGIRPRDLEKRSQKNLAQEEAQSEAPGAPLSSSLPPSHTNPLFPPLPTYGPPSWMRMLQCWFFRLTSSFLSLGFLIVICCGAVASLVPKGLNRFKYYARFQSPFKRRPFYQEEERRRKKRRLAERAWVTSEGAEKGINTVLTEKEIDEDEEDDELDWDKDDFIPSEGGPDPLVCDVAYYARRVGLDAETFDVQTEDGFIIELWHVFNPREYERPPDRKREEQGPDLFRTTSKDSTFGETQRTFPDGNKRYPVLMMHGLLQSAGAYCCNDDRSLAFYLAKSGYDVWLGNNRCGFNPRHVSLTYDDPRMWAWNIRQMGVMDLPALISRVLAETGFPKLALIAHSQGTTQTLVALAKEQRPDIGEKISVFCALAPAAYAGPLIGKIYFKIMRAVPPSWFRLIFGIHAFIPIMLEAHKYLQGAYYAGMGYRVFSYLFSWSDLRWERDLRGRMFQFAPVYVSAESMRWWLGRECFAKQKCILATREEGRLEDKEDEEDDAVIKRFYVDREPHVSARRKLVRNLSSFHCQTTTHQHHDSTRGKYSWYNEQFPPLALWVCGNDDLVDGRRLLRRFDRGREPKAKIVHKKIIEGYEHLDVIWAVDMIQKVGKEVREVIWRTAPPASRKLCRTPAGCEGSLQTEEQVIEHERRASFSSSSTRPRRRSTLTQGRPRMASISEDSTMKGFDDEGDSESVPRTWIEGSRGEWTKHIDEKPFREEDEDESIAAISTRRGSEVPFIDVEERGNPLG
ncbi:alpha/beta-hydrolase [Polychaeton citri CBS 116435]|uniref:Alpha/beta-hydrolase n=1 Tax=Polychaeton citri CBS 116435 TaxID=1314669 RepID=A0A9P4UT83_9PEZI|nr:alpha/beta-hydrolase [Polychaeton citri CBS 116435]